MTGRVIALSGGVGGAKLAHGLARVLPAGDLTVIVNTGDDFRHLGLEVSPDIDTLLYTLADIADPVQGWGRRDETWSFMQALERLGGEVWFRLGDGDLAMHLERTRRLAAGETLTAVTERMRRHLGIATAVLPMTDDPVRTRLRTDEGWLDFQEYFVRRRCQPAVRDVVYQGAAAARPSATLMQALSADGLRAVVICPSNPLLSIEPMLSMPGVRAALSHCAAPVLAVSPLIGGQAVKGPAAKMLRELGCGTSAAMIAHRYAGLIDGLFVDDSDMGSTAPAGVDLIAAPILMIAVEHRERLAGAVLAAADRIAARKR